jgi:thiol:disulfide interchange protein DsbC
MSKLQVSKTRPQLLAFLAGLCALTLCTQAAAQATTIAADATSLAAFEQRFRASNPGTRIDSVAVSSIPGLFEVVMGKNVAYIEPTGRYALFGHIFDMQARRDLTADRKASLDKVDVLTLPKDLAIRHVRGNGTRVLYVFSDPQCGFCKALERALVEVQDVTVYTFLTPILGPESKRLAVAINCSADPAAAWSAWMLRGEQPREAPASCRQDSDAIDKLAQAVGVAGTPTLISGDGRKTAGAMSGAQLSAWLAQSVPHATPAATAPQAAAGRASTTKTLAR